jgi:predicted transcriptional regulator
LNVLISIKPQFVQKILSGIKKYEYRKKVFKKTNIDKVYIYASSPNKKIVGFFNYSGYLEGTPLEIWNKTKNYSGIKKVEYDEYFINKDKAIAFNIEGLTIFNNPIDPYTTIHNFKPPQSFMYTKNGWI